MAGTGGFQKKKRHTRAKSGRTPAVASPASKEPVRSMSRPKSFWASGENPHVTARREGRGSWGEFPGENWPAFTAEEWKQFLTPPAGAKTGDQWNLDAALTKRILNHFHPQTEDCSDKDRNDLKVATLTAELQDDGSLKLSGKVTLMRAFYPGKKEMNLTTAGIEGFSRAGEFTLVTLDDARFGKEKFYAAAVWRKS